MLRMVIGLSISQPIICLGGTPPHHPPVYLYPNDKNFRFALPAPLSYPDTVGSFSLSTPTALASARAALRLDSGSPQAHLILGSILAVDPRTRAESIPHLERAAETLPSARATLRQIRQARQPHTSWGGTPGAAGFSAPLASRAPVP